MYWSIWFLILKEAQLFLADCTALKNAVQVTDQVLY